MTGQNVLCALCIFGIYWHTQQQIITISNEK